MYPTTQEIFKFIALRESREAEYLKEHNNKQYKVEYSGCPNQISNFNFYTHRQTQIHTPTHHLHNLQDNSKSS